MCVGSLYRQIFECTNRISQFHAVFLSVHDKFCRYNCNMYVGSLVPTNFRMYRQNPEKALLGAVAPPPPPLAMLMGTVVPWVTALCSAILHPPEVKSLIWWIVQREHIVENLCDLLGFKYFQRLLSMQFMHSKSCWIFYCAFYKEILHFLNLDTALKNKINNWLLGTPGYSLSYIHVFESYTVKPRPEAHGHDPFLGVFEEYPLDSTRSDSTVTLSII